MHQTKINRAFQKQSAFFFWKKFAVAVVTVSLKKNVRNTHLWSENGALKFRQLVTMHASTLLISNKVISKGDRTGSKHQPLLNSLILSLPLTMYFRFPPNLALLH